MKEIFRAVSIAANSKDNDKSYYLGCVALRYDGVLVTSTNTTVIENQTPSAHAEARALRKAGRGAILWVARVLKDRKTWAMAKPCKNCRARILNKEVIKVYYTTGPGEFELWVPGNNDVFGYDKIG